jgi:hypothetical protein
MKDKQLKPSLVHQAVQETDGGPRLWRTFQWWTTTGTNDAGALLRSVSVGGRLWAAIGRSQVTLAGSVRFWRRIPGKIAMRN